MIACNDMPLNTFLISMTFSTAIPLKKTKGKPIYVVTGTLPRSTSNQDLSLN